MKIILILIFLLNVLSRKATEEEKYTMNLSAMSYTNERPENSIIIYDNETDVYGFISKKNETTYYVIRGTSSIMNYIDDAEILLEDWGKCMGGKVHKGFKKITENLLPKLKENLKNEKRIVATGHSLGAAIAAMSAIEGSGAKMVYGYGMPRIGNYNYSMCAHRLKTPWAPLRGAIMPQPRIKRYTHMRDIVPHLPPLKTYYHLWEETFEDENGNLIDCGEINESPECGGEQFTLQETNVADHMIYLGIPIP